MNACGATTSAEKTHEKVNGHKKQQHKAEKEVTQITHTNNQTRKKRAEKHSESQRTTATEAHS
jgi:hypothetical protein